MHSRTPVGCPVCGGRDVERDEVLDAGPLGLAACTRCGHRWTERPLARARAIRAAETGAAEAA
jgi:uncharacterized Zn finger protein